MLPEMARTVTMLDVMDRAPEALPQPESTNRHADSMTASNVSRRSRVRGNHKIGMSSRPTAGSPDFGTSVRATVPGPDDEPGENVQAYPEGKLSSQLRETVPDQPLMEPISSLMALLDSPGEIEMSVWAGCSVKS